MSETSDSFEPNEARTAGNTLRLINLALWRRVTAWSVWLKVTCGLSVAWLFVANLLRLDSSWCLAPSLVIASMDLFTMTWRFLRDPESKPFLKIVGATIGVTGATCGRAYAASRVAEVLGADANIAPHCQLLAALVYMPLCIAGFLSIALLIVGFLLAAAFGIWRGLNAMVSYVAVRLSDVLLLLYGWSILTHRLLQHAGWLAAALFGSRGTLRLDEHCPAAESEVLDHHVSKRLRELSLRAVALPVLFAPRTRVSFIQCLRVLLLLIPILMLLQLFDAESTSGTVNNVISALAVKLDFRRQMTGTGNAECLNLTAVDHSVHIASIPNVDDAVLTARCVRTFGEIFHSSGPWCRFKRERCCRFDPCESGAPALKADERPEQ